MITFFVTPVYAGEVDNKSLLCHFHTPYYQRSHTEVPTMGLLFSGGTVSIGELFSLNVPVEVEWVHPGEYTENTNNIWIPYSNTDKYRIDRKTLELYYVDTKIGQCELKGFWDVVEYFQPYIDAIKERMKDNKL